MFLLMFFTKTYSASDSDSENEPCGKQSHMRLSPSPRDDQCSRYYSRRRLAIVRHAELRWFVIEETYNSAPTRAIFLFHLGYSCSSVQNEFVSNILNTVQPLSVVENDSTDVGDGLHFLPSFQLLCPLSASCKLQPIFVLCSQFRDRTYHGVLQHTDRLSTAFATNDFQPQLQDNN